MKFKTKIFFILLICTLSCLGHAGEGLFSRAYTTETVPEGHYEFEETTRWRTHRSFGSYSAVDLKSEFEYGVRDNFQMAFYVNALYLDANKAPDDNDNNGETGFSRSGLALQSVSAEFVYRILNAVTDPIGLAIYMEPEYIFTDLHNGDPEYNGFANEFRLLLQKNLMGDQLILVYNLVAEFEYFRYQGVDAPFKGEFDVNNELGASYRFASNWYGGWEIRNHNELGNFWSHDHALVWMGPAIHYGGQRFWGTLGILYEIYGNPSGPDSAGSDQGPSGLFLHSHELLEVTAKVGFPF